MTECLLEREPAAVRQHTGRVLAAKAVAGRANPQVSVVIPCYNQAHFLDEAVESVRVQSVSSAGEPPEIIVVDDGSTDATPEVASRYAGVRYLRQRNAGLAAARNAGLAACHGDLVVFLDADDRLLPTALEAGCEAFATHPDSAFVYGAFRHIDREGAPREDEWKVQAVHGPPYEHMLRHNFVTMHATVMYRRDVLERVGGFDTTLPGCEDWELYLRLTRRFEVYCHRQPVAEYRLHETSMSKDYAMMMASGLRVLKQQRAFVRGNRRLEEAQKKGVQFCKDFYGNRLTEYIDHLRKEGQGKQAMKQAIQLMKHAPLQFAGQAARRVRAAGAGMIREGLPQRVRDWRSAVTPGPRSQPPVGKVHMGDLRRLEPIDRPFGYGRGTPLCRHYIEQHLAHHAQDVRGCVMEIKDAAYTHRFGGDRVTKSEVWDVDESNPAATIVADLAAADHVPDASFDCIILTQTLHLIYDFHSALATVYRMLKPGGVLLASVPGITKVEKSIPWHWSFTEASARKLMLEAFAPEDVEVQAHGNVLVAQSYLQGIAAEELEPHELAHYDPEYPIVMTIRAEKPAEAAA